MEMAGRTFKNLQSGVPLLFGGKEQTPYELVSRAMAVGGGEWGCDTPSNFSYSADLHYTWSNAVKKLFANSIIWICN